MSEDARFRLAAVALLAVMAALMVWSERVESLTFDEPMHIGSGMSYVKTGDYAFNFEHPPLAKALSAIPPFLAGATLPAGPIPRGTLEAVDWNRKLLTDNTLPYDTLVLLARLPMIGLTLLLGGLIAWWCRERFGRAAGLAALALFVFDPGFLAHGHYVTTDVPAALGLFAGCVFWSRYLDQRTWGRLAAATLAVGLALGMKFTCVLLLPLLPVLGVLQTRSFKWWKGALVVTAGAAAIVMLMYAPDGLRILGPRHPWVHGFEVLRQHNKEGHESYLMGEVSQYGSWRYFLVVLGVKSTCALLLLSAMSFARGVPPVVWLPALALLGAALSSNLNLGLRHVLPMYPFLFAAAAALYARGGLWMRRAVIALVLLHASESLANAPNHMAFFNLASGGPARGHEWLLDSNLDWGQDLKKVPKWLDEHGFGRRICLTYFGMADTESLRLIHHSIPWTSMDKSELNCIGVISVTLVHDLYLEPGSYQWLREQKQPIGRIGASLWVYDLRQAGASDSGSSSSP